VNYQDRRGPDSDAETLKFFAGYVAKLTKTREDIRMREALVKLPAESQSFMQRLLSKGTYGIRLREGGYGLLNLQNLIGYTVYPGVLELPADAWMAQPEAT
jgi:hypothetical protein